MALPLLAVTGAASTLSSLLDAFKSTKKPHGRHEAAAPAENRPAGQNLPAGSASQAGFDPTQLLARMDADKSGAVSQGEFGDFLKSLDKSKGGLLELQAQASGATTDQVASMLFGKLDADGDGSLTGAELATVGPGGSRNPADGAQGGSQLSLSDQLMKSFDANGDGSISRDEIAAALDASRNGRERGGSAVKATQPNLEALAMRAIQAYNRTLSAGGSSTTA